MPILFKNLVDYLHKEMPNLKISNKAEIVFTTAFWMVIYCKRILTSFSINGSVFLYLYFCRLFTDSLYRFASTFLQEARNAVFARIDQSFQRQLNKETFKHLLNLDLSYHKQRDLGAINQALNRGTRQAQHDETLAS